MQKHALHHEQLDVYKVAIAFVARAVQITKDIPRGHGALLEQFRRASVSIPLNIAEGYGKRGAADRSRFYDIARGSAHECGAIMDVLKVLALVTEEDFGRGKNLLHRTVSMLVKMVA